MSERATCFDVGYVILILTTFLKRHTCLLQCELENDIGLHVGLRIFGKCWSVRGIRQGVDSCQWQLICEERGKRLLIQVFQSSYTLQSQESDGRYCDAPFSSFTLYQGHKACICNFSWYVRLVYSDFWPRCIRLDSHRRYSHVLISSR